MMSIKVSLIVILSIGSLYAYPKCRMPNGYTGECRYLVKCKPLLEISEKKLRTDDELLYLRQSSCGTPSNFRYKVCCPLQSDWSKKLDIRPVPYPELIDFTFEPGAENQTRGITFPKHVDSKDSAGFYLSILDNIKKINAYKTNVDSDECGVHSPISDSALGNQATAAKQYPWLVLLEYSNGGINCGGSLISRRYVMTAGHCVDTFNGPPTAARLSEYNMTSNPTDIVRKEDGEFEFISITIIPVEWSERHPLFDRNNYQHDIGIVKMTHDVHYTDFIRPICLPRIDYTKQFDITTKLMTAGWGIAGGYASDVKRDAMLPYMPMKACKRSHSTRTLSTKQICAGGGLDTVWAGDSGGPLMFENDDSYMAIGVGSYGPAESGVTDVPMVYTNVYEYLDWIESMTQ